MSEVCEEVTSETHLQETDYVEQIKVNSAARNYFGSLESKECTSEADFIVVPNDFSCLLGLKTVQEMGLFIINDDNFIAQVSSDTSLLGNLGEAQLHVNPEVPPRALPCRKVPLALQEHVKQELERLVEIGVLIPVAEPTVCVWAKWLSLGNQMGL